MTLDAHLANVQAAQVEHDAAVEKRATAQREELVARERVNNAQREFDECLAALKKESRTGTLWNPIPGLPEK